MSRLCVLPTRERTSVRAVHLVDVVITSNRALVRSVAVQLVLVVNRRIGVVERAVFDDSVDVRVELNAGGIMGGLSVLHAVNQAVVYQSPIDAFEREAEHVVALGRRRPGDIGD